MAILTPRRGSQPRLGERDDRAPIQAGVDEISVARRFVSLDRGGIHDAMHAVRSILASSVSSMAFDVPSVVHPVRDMSISGNS